ncbi:MAG TPA: zf-HC2 domain-containing protein [Vicinamibacteria bacterium]|nr:zf-HC2 domain-containing protein [Vicinamibacteria bacterium]
MDCRRAEELLSDHYERTLDPVRRADLDAHLSGCADCRALRAALGDVVEALRTFPVLEPPARLAERVAAAALVRPRVAAPSVLAPPPWRIPAWLPAAAAGLALVTTGAALLATGPEGPTRAATRLLDRTVNAGVYLIERKDRLVEDVRILRVLIGTAFEGRLDKMNDRVDDYRRLLERRRNAEEDHKKSRGSAAVGSSILTARLRSFRTGTDLES